MKRIFAVFAGYYRNFYYRRSRKTIILMTLAQLILPLSPMIYTHGWFQVYSVSTAFFAWWVAVPAIVWLIDCKHGRTPEQEARKSGPKRKTDSSCFAMDKPIRIEETCPSTG